MAVAFLVQKVGVQGCTQCSRKVKGWILTVAVTTSPSMKEVHSGYGTPASLTIFA